MSNHLSQAKAFSGLSICNRNLTLVVPNAKSIKGLLDFLHQLREIRHSGISFGKKYDPMGLQIEIKIWFQLQSEREFLRDAQSERCR